LPPDSEQPLETLTQIFEYEKWAARLPELGRQYQSAKPYPHIVLDDFLNPEPLEDCVREFNRLNETDGWINYTTIMSGKKD
jgi:hypothetical protein